ncbi:hypothetical protein, partial [Alloalcanivorax xenomutans]|uniref:hypothetical protein n=1 Tax=Alloalcanivorax xenomutans TaxID=1094342 RepID=UPI001F15852A
MLAAFQQLVDQFIVNRRFASSCHEILLGSLSWLKTQNSGHPPQFPAYFSTMSQQCRRDWFPMVEP